MPPVQLDDSEDIRIGLVQDGGTKKCSSVCNVCQVSECVCKCTCMGVFDCLYLLHMCTKILILLAKRGHFWAFWLVLTAARDCVRVKAWFSG